VSERTWRASWELEQDEPDLIGRVAAVMHDKFHEGSHRWYEDGRDCPDGKSDANAWLHKASSLVNALRRAGMDVHRVMPPTETTVTTGRPSWRDRVE
jgi:hypothetical protein